MDISVLNKNINPPKTSPIRRRHPASPSTSWRPPPLSWNFRWKRSHTPSGPSDSPFPLPDQKKDLKYLKRPPSFPMRSGVVGVFRIGAREPELLIWEHQDRNRTSPRFLVANVPVASQTASQDAFQGAAKGGRQKEFDHFFSFSGLFRSLFGHFFWCFCHFFRHFFAKLLLPDSFCGSQDAFFLDKSQEESQSLVISNAKKNRKAFWGGGGHFWGPKIAAIISL